MIYERSGILLSNRHNYSFRHNVGNELRTVSLEVFPLIFVIWIIAIYTICH